MWQRAVFNQLGQGSTFVFITKRSMKAYVRTPRRILTEKQMKAMETRNRTKEVVYESSDLMADQTSRSAIQKSRGSLFGESAMLRDYDNFNHHVKRQRVLPLHKLDKTTNINFVSLMSGLRTKSYRDKTKQILLEGKRLIMDALLAGCRLKTLIYCDPKLIEQLPIVEDEGERIFIEKSRMATWSLLEAPPGIMAVVERPDYETLMNDDVGKTRMPLTVVVDGIREPSNVGAVIRTLVAAGCEKILLMKGCCDPWEEKVLRSGMGAHFRVPIFTNIEWSRLVNYVPDNFRVFLADSNSFEVIKEAASYFDGVVSNEELSKEDNSDQFGDSANAVEVVRYRDEIALHEEVQLRRPKLSPEQRHTLPIFEYHEPLYFGSEHQNSHCLLIVGGETSSLSAAAYQFAHLHSGCKVHISMANNINSLNTGTALGIVAFEIQRQFRKMESVKLALEDGSSPAVSDRKNDNSLLDGNTDVS